MKSKIFIVVILFMGLLPSCGRSEDKPIEAIGVHKIVVKLSGIGDVSVSASFQDVGMSKLYNGAGEYKGYQYLVTDNLVNLSEIVCYTDDKGTNLLGMLSMTCIDEGTSVNYSIKAYINGNLVDEIKGKKDFSASSPVEMIELFTKER